MSTLIGLSNGQLTLFVASLLFAGLFLAMAPEEPKKGAQTPATLKRQAENAFRLQSYNEAIARSLEFLKSNPAEADANAARRILGLSYLRLKRYDEGFKTIADLLTRDKSAANDAELHADLGLAGTEQPYLVQPKQVMSWLNRAIELYAAQNNVSKQVDLLFTLANFHHRFGNQIYTDVSPERQKRQLFVLVEVLKTYDQILAMSVTAEIQIRALAAKAQVLMQNSYWLSQLKREEWPAGVDLKYDLTKPAELAIEFEREIVRRFPAMNAAPAALLQIATIHEQYRRDFLAAIDAYNEIIRNYSASGEATQARKHIEAITTPQLSLDVEGVFKPEDKVTFRWQARNVATISLAAYPIDLFKTLRIVNDWTQLDRLSVEKRQPEVVWKIETGDRARHEFLTNGATPAEAPLKESHAYLIIAKGTSRAGKAVETRTIFLVSRLGMAAKNGAANHLIYAVDAITGRPRQGTKLLIQHTYSQRIPILNTWRVVHDYAERDVSDAGLANIANVFAKQEGQIRVIAREQNDYAIVEGGIYGIPRWYMVQDQTLRCYGYSDRPVYRPGQIVNFKHILRRYQAGEYKTPANLQVRVQINDSRGNSVYDKTHHTSATGAIDGSLELGSTAALGVYTINLFIEGQNVEAGPGMNFRVEEYKKPEFEVAISCAKPAIKVGDTLAATIHGEYYFGGPVVGAQVQYTVKRNEYWHAPDWPIPYPWFGGEAAPSWQGRWRPKPTQRTDVVKTGTLVTDEKGNANIEIPTAPFEKTPSADLEYIIEARMTDASRRQINGSKTIRVTHKAVYLSVKPQHNLYQPGDRIRASVKAENANRQPVALDASVLLARVDQREIRDEGGHIKTAEKLTIIERIGLPIDANGEADVAFEVKEAGYYKITAEAQDAYGGKTTGDAYAWVSKPGDRNSEWAHIARSDLELVVDKDVLPAGETCHVLLASRHPDAYVWLTAEADDVYWNQVVYVPKNAIQLELPIPASFRPNVTLTASMFRDNKFVTEERALKVPPVEQLLTVTIKTPKSKFRPRETATVAVEVVDHKGKPVAGEFSLGCIDASVLYIQPETRGDIRSFFHGRERYRSTRTETSYAFRLYTANTDRLSEASSEAPGAAMGGVPAPAAFAEGAVALRRGRSDAMGMVDEARSKGMPAFAPTEVRTEFPDTVYWAAHLTTGPDGKGTATIKFPDSLTEWRLTAIAHTAGSEVGEVKTEVRTKKDVIVRLQAPRFFVEKDEVVLSAIAHNYLEGDKTIRVELSVTPELGFPADPESTETKYVQSQFVDLSVPASGEKRFDVRARVLRPGRVRVLAKALADVESDAAQLEFPVKEWGAEKLLASGGRIASRPDTATPLTLQIAIPKEIRPGSQSLSLRIQPTIAGVMLEALPYLIDYPYGCTEQTMSRFLPAVLASRTLKTLGIDLASLRNLPAQDPIIARRLEEFRKNPVYDPRELEKIVKAGVDRLVEFQQPDGGWGWWKTGGSDLYMTAYVLSGLATARDAGVAVPAGVIERATNFLAQRAVDPRPVHRYPWLEEENVALRVYMIHALAVADPRRLGDPAIREQLREAFRKRDELADTSRALLTLASHAAKMIEERDILLANLKDRARIDKETDAASWGEPDNFYFWYQCGTEATSHSLKALLVIEPNSPLVAQAVQWLMRHRKGTRWFSTKDTAEVCAVLADYLKASGELDPNLEVTIEIAGRTSKTIKITRENLLTCDNEVTLVGDALGVGPQDVAVTVRGKGNVYWTAAARFFTKEDPISAAGNELFVERTYAKLTPREVEKTRKVFDRNTKKQVDEKYTAIEYDRVALKDGDSLASGDLVDVDLKITAKNNFEYLLFEDFKPAGCEPTELVSGFTWGGGVAGHREFRDDRVAFFASYLNQGEHRLNYRLRAEIPGVFHALPARAECMYAPLVRGNSASYVLKVIEAAKP